MWPVAGKERHETGKVKENSSLYKKKKIALNICALIIL